MWELMQRQLDDRIKATGHENAYFPLFIPVSFLEKEATHVEGFAKECAVVTHHRLEARDGKLVPVGELEEPLVVRPTSETIIGESFSRWVQSYRDLPLLINQWANVVRWEMRTRLFLRTAEFLWQEGHTAHATEAEAVEETVRMHGVYQEYFKNVLALPGVVGEKCPSERFPGAERSFTIEVMMQDGKALQACTSHYLGQNFAKGSNIQFVDKDGAQQFAYTTSWGASTRMIGGIIMTHGDDDGLRLPPRIAPKQIVILPVIPKPEVEAEVLAYANEIAGMLRQVRWDGIPLTVHVDARDMRGGDKNWQWIKKGAPIRIEVGPRDIEKRAAMVARRDMTPKDRSSIGIDSLAEQIPAMLQEIHDTYYRQACEYQAKRTRTDIGDFEGLKAYFENDSAPGFVVGKWSGDSSIEEKLAELKVTVRCLPSEQSGTAGRCLVTGLPATIDAVYARSY
jgi:prolyl-tRNA synthetase